jgi:hypothetical protein
MTLGGSRTPSGAVPAPASIRDRARHLRQIAREFAHDVVFSRRVREMADELDAQANCDEAREGDSGT